MSDSTSISNVRIYEFYNHAIASNYRDTLREFAAKNYAGINTQWAEENIEFLVMKIGIHMIGLLVMIPYEDDKVHIMLIAVDKAYRKKGLGTKLLIYVAGKYHNKKVSLNITLDKLHLINFYCKKKYAVAEKICLEDNIVIMSLNHVTLLAKIPLPNDEDDSIDSSH